MVTQFDITFAKIFRNSSRIFSTLWEKEKKAIVTLFSVFSLNSASPFLQSGIRALLINELIIIAGTGKIDEKILALLILSVCASILPSVLYASEEYLSRVFRFRLDEHFELLIIKKLGNLDLATHENPKHQDLIQKINENGTWRLRNFTDRQFYLTQNIVEVGIAALILLSAKWWILPLMIIGTIPELIVETRYGRNVWDIHTSRAETRRRFWNLRSYFREINSIAEIKLFQSVPHFFSLIQDLFKSFRKEEEQIDRKKLIMQLISLTLSHAVIAGITVWFVMHVIRGNILVGTLTFFLASMSDLRTSLSSFFGNIGRQYQDNLFVTDIFVFLDLPNVLEKPETGFRLKTHETPEIIFENVSFAYPDSEKEVLKKISLRVAPGDKIALVGLNGAGKTTLIKLLCRFYDPTKGRILIDGQDLRTVDLESWYHMLGALFQDYVRYHLLTKEAIAIGRSTIASKIERIKDAAKAAEADVFIEEWEKAYEQMLGKTFWEGIEPSIGQWQKLALARTFYRDPRILILDEPTASIDTEAEEKIFEKLEALPKDRTIFIISHRFSTVRHADKIIVLKNGRIAECGSHNELLALPRGTYARLFKIQAKGYR